MDDIYRINNKNIINKILKNTKKHCIITKKKQNYLFYSDKNKNIYLKFNNLLGKSDTSRDGEVYDINIEGIKLAIKVIPFKKQYTNTEINIMKETSNFVENNICPNFNLLFYNFNCIHDNKYNYKNKNINKILDEYNDIKDYNDVINKILLELNNKKIRDISKYENFQNFPILNNKIYNYILKSIKETDNIINNYKLYNKNSIIILSELSDIDLNTYLSTLKNSKEDMSNIISSIIIQIVISLLVLHSKGRIIHMDLHTGNILLNKVNKDGYRHYKHSILKSDSSQVTHDSEYFIKNEGYQVKIADFGRSYKISYSKDNKELLSKLLKQLKRFFPLWYNDISSEEFENILKEAHNLQLDWTLQFDIWRIFSSIKNTIYKNNIIINSELSEYFSLIIQIFENQMISMSSSIYLTNKDVKNKLRKTVLKGNNLEIYYELLLKVTKDILLKDMKKITDKNLLLNKKVYNIYIILSKSINNNIQYSDK